MDYKNVKGLESFLDDCEKELLSNKNRKEVLYKKKYIVPWDSVKLKNDNECLLKEITGNANVYAIFACDKGETKYSLRYLGQSKSKSSRTRLTNHLIKKNEKTGAKLSKVIDHVQAGGSIKVSWISITPESLRHYVEEQLIEKHPECEWNKHGKKT